MLMDAQALAVPQPERLNGLPGMATVIAKVDVFGKAEVVAAHTSRTHTKVHPSQSILGGASGTDQIENGVRYPVSGVVVDWSGKLINTLSKVELKIGQVDYSVSGTTMTKADSTVENKPI